MQSGCTASDGSRALAVAAVLVADALTRDRTADEIGRMAAFFTVLGDTMALLAFDPQLKQCQDSFNQEKP